MWQFDTFGPKYCTDIYGNLKYASKDLKAKNSPNYILCGLGKNGYVLKQCEPYSYPIK